MNEQNKIIYDTHSDIFHNLYERAEQGIDDPFNQYHLQNLAEGNVKGGIWVVYGDQDFDVYRAYQLALEKYQPYQKNYNVVFGLEGLRNVKDLDSFKKLYDLGIRHSSLTWNEENHLACGVAGSSEQGLTKLGESFLDFMIEHQMIIDVSHLNQKSFYDVINYLTIKDYHNVIASHSNSYTLCPHRRNLIDDQLVAIAKIGGYVGVVSARNFVSADDNKKTCASLVNHIIYIAKIIGIDHLMLGLDMMDYLGDYSSHNANLDDLVTHADAQNIIKEMRNKNISEEDIDKVSHLNFIQLLKKAGLYHEKNN